MDDPAVVLASVVVGGILGGVVTALSGEWRAKRDSGRQDRRDRDAALAAWNREQLESTVRVLLAGLEEYRALAIGDSDGIARADAMRHAHEFGYVGLLGDVSVIKEYQDTTLYMAGRVGKGLSPEDQVRLAILGAKVQHAANAQIERAIRGLPLARVTDAEADAAGVIRMVDLAEQMVPPSQPSSMAGRKAAIWLAIRRRWDRWRSRR